jgi:hypothetical protein
MHFAPSIALMLAISGSTVYAAPSSELHSVSASSSVSAAPRVAIKRRAPSTPSSDASVEEVALERRENVAMMDWFGYPCTALGLTTYELCTNDNLVAGCAELDISNGSNGLCTIQDVYWALEDQESLCFAWGISNCSFSALKNAVCEDPVFYAESGSLCWGRLMSYYTTPSSFIQGETQKWVKAH